MPTLSQYNILSRLRSKIVVSRALVNQDEGVTSGDQNNEPREQEDVPRPISASSAPDQSDASDDTTNSNDASSTVTRADTPREQRVRSSKLTSMSENWKMSALPEVETNDALLTDSNEISLNEKVNEMNKEHYAPIEVASLFNEDSSPIDEAAMTVLDSTQTERNVRTPARPCLKRGDSCFIRRPESRSKSVTFDRPFSVTSDRSRTSLESSQSDVSLPDIHGGSQMAGTDDDSSDNDDNVFKSDEERAMSRERKRKKSKWQTTRPSSCGPSIQRSSQLYSVLQRIETERQKSFDLNRRPSFENLPVLPKFSFGGFFSVRRGSMINRSLFSSAEHPSRWFKDLQSPTDKKDLYLEPYETYIIRNCRLVRKDRLGPNYNSMDSPKDLKKRFDFTDDTSSPNESEEVNADNTMKVSNGDTETKGDNFADTELREQDAPGLRIDINTEILRWSNEKQAIVVERPTSASETNGLMVQKSTIWKEDVMHIPDDQKEELLKLGFRKPPKPKKKKNKAEKRKTETETVAPPQRIEINLKEDPLLIKVSKKNKNVGHFIDKPQPQPNAVCFEIYGTSQTHLEVKIQLQKLLKTCPEVKLVSIMFDHRAVYNNSFEMYNRWIITTSSILGRNRLAGCELVFGEEVVQLRRYDDVVFGEFQQFTRMQNFVKMMNNRKILGKAAVEKKMS